MNIPVKSLEITQPQPYRYVSDEFFALIDAGLFGDRNVELVEGELIELPPPGSEHSRYQGRVMTALASIVATMTGVWLGGDTGILVDGDTVIGSDAVIATDGEHLSALNGGRIMLAVEISVSTIGYDLGGKVRLYERAGVAALWVVDPQASVIHSFAQLEDGIYRSRKVVRFGEPLPVAGTDQTIVID